MSFALIFSSFLIFLFGSPDDHVRFALQGIATLLLLGNFGAYKFSGDYFTVTPNPLVHTWSLSVEEQIYLFLPVFLLIFFINRVYSYKKLIKFLIFLVLVSLISFLFPQILQPIYSLAGVQFASQFSFYSPIARIWQFLLGGLLYLFVSRRNGSKIRFKKLYLCAFIFLLFAPLKIDVKTISILATLITVLVIFSKSLNLLPRKVINKLEWLGDRSYSIYLIHLPLLYIANFSPVVLIGDSENRLIQQIFGVFGSILIGSIIYSKIECRFRIQNLNVNISGKVIALSFILPISMFAIMNTGANNHYWGLDKNITKPIFPENVDPECVKKSLIVQPCIYPKQNSNFTAILVGDSHAGHISQAFIEAAHNAQFNAIVWALSACKVNFSSKLNEFNSKNCIDRNSSLKKWITNNRPTVVIVSQYLTTNNDLSEIKDALLQLKNLVPNLLIIENTPVFPATDGFMQSRPLIMPPAKPRKIVLKSEMNSKDDLVSNQISLWAQGGGIQTMNVNSAFCNLKECSRYFNGEWLYRDPNHFTLAGAQLLVPKISKYLNHISNKN
jgi:peptidoglycan/LPS O-acetylase OafA/YrhL